MKRNKVIATLLASLFIAVSASAILAPGRSSTATANVAFPQYGNEAVQQSDSVVEEEVRVRPAAINMLARSYGDSIVLRWAPEDYVTWNYLNHVGYNLYRIYTDKSGVLHDDLIAEGIRPLSLEQLRARYPESDSLAFVAVGMIYGEGGVKPNQTRERYGEMGAMLEIYEDQQTQYAFAEMVAEWRPDVAQAIGLRYVDRDVKQGLHYQYILQPAKRDSLGRLPIAPGSINLECTKYKPVDYAPTYTDTVSTGLSLVLKWKDNVNSTFEIERRLEGETEWKRLTVRPYASALDLGFDKEELNRYSDVVEKPGVYEYRVLAYDAFGDLLVSSTTHKVRVGDVDAPTPPTIRQILITREGDPDSTQVITAHVEIEKAEIEDDCIGFMPLYYNERYTGKQWKSISETMFSPTDTVLSIDVSRLSTGMLTIAAVDTAGNMGYSMPVQLRIEDKKAPEPPLNFKAEVEENGRIHLSWSPAPEDCGDIAFYEVAVANDTTHQFVIISPQQMRDTTFTDSVAVDVNQKYIYYKVRAIDYASNIGQYTKILQVERPHLLPPTPAHLDTLVVDTEGIHLCWIAGADKATIIHNVFRRLENQPDWELIASLNADSVAADNYRIRIDDNPPFNNKRRYEYVVESFNSTGISSGPSLVVSVMNNRNTAVNVSLNLVGRYDSDAERTRLSWDCEGEQPDGERYWGVYVRKPGKDSFEYLISEDINEPLHSNRLLSPGETAEFYVKLLYSDGRASKPSNIVKVTAPQKK